MVSHAGFVLPLKGILSAQVLCGLIIGSVVPDFGYFIRAFELASFAHTLAGAFCVSLPVGLFVYLLVHRSFGRIANALPNPHSSFCKSWGIHRPFTKRGLLGITVAILIGALAHNFVDSFTHESGAAVAMFPGLRQEVFHFGDEPLPVFRILQYSGTVLGMAMILVAYGFGFRRYCRTSGSRVWQDSKSWLALFGLAGVTLLCAAAWNAKWIPRELDFYAFRVFGFKFLITWLPLVGVAFLGYALLRPARPNRESNGREQAAARSRSGGHS